MNRLRALVLGTLVFGLLGGNASASDFLKAIGFNEAAPKAAAPAAPCCDDCGDHGHFLFDFEATFFRLHGTELFSNSGDVFGYEFAPRITVGYVGSSGLGLRARWWYYNHSGTDSADETYDLSTSNLDAELFKEIELGSCTRLEWSAGLRFNRFDLVDGDDGQDFHFSGPGIVVGAKISHAVWGGVFYASFRHAWLMGDVNEDFEGDDPETDFDSTHTITEGAIGYEYSRCLSNGSVLTLRAGLEMQNWSDYEVNGGAEDIGFGGFVLGLGLSY